MVTEKILAEVSTANIFAIISDELHYAATIEKNIVLGYVHKADVYVDIVQGIELVEDVQEQMRELKDVDKWHTVWFEMAVDVAEAVNIELTILHGCGRRTQKSNIPADVPKVYYRRTLTVLFLDHLISKLSDRFSANAKVITLGLLLSSCYFDEKVRELVRPCEDPCITV